MKVTSLSFFYHANVMGMIITFFPLLLRCSCMQIRRTWSTKHWCESVINPEWPFAYSKYKGQMEETKGRVSSNRQDVRHVCETRGVQSKCHRCEDIQCGTQNDVGGEGQTCHFQLQGVSWRDMSTNIPTVSDVPFAVGGLHRYDFGGITTSHVCMYMSQTPPCQSSFGTDYSHCPLRCWGHGKGMSGLNNTAGVTTTTVDGTVTGSWPNVKIDSIQGVNTTPWTRAEPTATWSYPKKDIQNEGQVDLRDGKSVNFLPQGYTFTHAGNGTAGFEDGKGPEARFRRPEGVAVDHEGYVYVADTGNHAIRMISPSGQVTTLAGTGKPGHSDGVASLNGTSQGHKAAEFSYPTGIAVWQDWKRLPLENATNPEPYISHDRNRTLYIFVSDTANHRIRKITGEVSYNDNGEKIISNASVECFAGHCSGIKTPTAGFSDGNRSMSRFDSPRGLTVSRNGDVYVADSNNNLIRVIDRWGMTTTLAGTVAFAEFNEFGLPLEGCAHPCLTGVSGRRDGSLNSTTFSFPSDVAIDAEEGFVLVSDRHNIRRVDLRRGVVKTIVGGDNEGEMDGDGNEASFNEPNGVSLTNDGFIYVADASSCRIRRVAPAELISPMIGCHDTISTVFRPPGCFSYNAPIDKFGMTATHVSGNVYHGHKHRHKSHSELGDAFIGRSLKNCIGSVPPLKLDKERWDGDTLVIDDHVAIAREDLNDGTVIKLRCPEGCSLDANISGWRYQETVESKSNSYLYSEQTPICLAAIHSNLTFGVPVEVTLHQNYHLNATAAFRFSHDEGYTEMSNRRIHGQAFSIRYGNDEMHVQTIAGSPSILLENSCGYKDSIPPQESKFGTPVAIAAYKNKSLDSFGTFLYVADRNNHAIRGISTICSFPCENDGRCIGPDICECEDGWEGVDCTIPICKVPCQDRELCVAPNTCSCIPGYSGKACMTATCVQDCRNGICIAPDTCSCDHGWFDANCTTPVCVQTCGNGGNCTGPNTCECPSEWGGEDCRTPTCTQTCENDSLCVAPDTCLCTPGWSGFTCSEPICHQGFFEPFEQENSSFWIEYRPCNVSKWCEEVDSFECRQRDLTLVPTLPLYGKQWRHVSGRENKPNHCLMIELGADMLSSFQYLNSWNNTTTDYQRISRVSPYDWLSRVRTPWNAFVEPIDSHTQPWGYVKDRQVALAELYEVPQGTYRCANGGNCIAPDVCACNTGWIGFDCRVPVCENGFYEPHQESFVDSSHDEDSLAMFEQFMWEESSYRLDPAGKGYSNPSYERTIELFHTEANLQRKTIQEGGQRYVFADGTFQGGYSCSIRSVTEWEDYRSGYLSDHPNFYSKYMDSKVQADGVSYSHWKRMNWPATHAKSVRQERDESDFSGLNTTSQRVFVYTNQGDKRYGQWYPTGESWQKGLCIVEFKRVCDDKSKGHDLEALLYTNESSELLVQDPDLSFRPRVSYDDSREYLDGVWIEDGNGCVDHVVRGCFNNGTCVNPNQCECAPGWSGADCKIPVCEQKCLHNSNCTLPNVCTCERGWRGKDCSTPICSQDCNNGGTCIAPDTCKCKQWENNWRDGRIEGGIPLFQTPSGDPQLTGWTGFDCSTPICVQAEKFVMNTKDPVSLVSLGGHGKDGKKECLNAVCPEYDEMVVTNDGRSFQTGCGFDPIDTGCCYKFSYEEKKKNETKFRYTCSRCMKDKLTASTYHLTCTSDDIVSWSYDSEDDVTHTFREHATGQIRLCGPRHDPDYYVSDDPYATSEFSNRNYLSNLTSDRFLCGIDAWEQGDFIDDAGLTTVIGVNADFGLKSGRHVRVNHNNYQRDPRNPYAWSHGPILPGEGVYACFNLGSCIAPDICTCRDGYDGFDCKTPICRYEHTNGEVVGCLNGGICQEKDNCRCIQTESILWKKYTNVDRGLTGWGGKSCSRPICVQGFYDASCTGKHAIGGEGCYRCFNGGFCVAPDVCSCAKGWTGYDCKTPKCEAKVNPIVKKQLMTTDPHKLHIFETDPCGMKGFYEADIVDGIEYHRGNCTLPNQCTCFCKSVYDTKLCRVLGGRYCIKPFQDPLHKHRNVLASDEVFGTRSCNAGYEGMVDKNDNFKSCHMRIYEPTYFVKNTVGLCFLFALTLLVTIIMYYCLLRRFKRNILISKVKRRRTVRITPKKNL